MRKTKIISVTIPPTLLHELDEMVEELRKDPSIKPGSKLCFKGDKNFLSRSEVICDCIEFGLKELKETRKPKKKAW